MSIKVDQTFACFEKRDGKFHYIEYDPENLIAGDTDSVYVDLSGVFDRSHKEEEVIHTADNLGKTINQSFPDFMQAVFNSPPERSYPIETEREAVSDKSYFMAPKMYAMHITNDEGKPVDKLKIMGLAIKKTDTPKVVQDGLQKIVELIIDGESYETVNAYVNKFRDHYHSLGMVDVGRPMNIKGLTKYEDKFRETLTVDGFPYHVRASMFYNALRSPNDPEIKSGDKIKVIYIKHPDSKYIAIPNDLDVIPDFLADFEIDWKTQWQKVEKKIIDFLKPIGYDQESRHRELVGSLLEF